MKNGNRANSLAFRASLTAVMVALVTVMTFLVRIPNPMGGYFNFGDVAVFIVALTFGPVIGGLAGGIGSAISDAIGFPLFVLPTLIIKGVEGLLAGAITNRKDSYRDILGVVIAGVEMVSGYFLVELYGLSWGLGAALAEIPINIVQIAIGGIIGIPAAYFLRRRLPEILK